MTWLLTSEYVDTRNRSIHDHRKSIATWENSLQRTKPNSMQNILTAVLPDGSYYVLLQVPRRYQTTY
jgi:hypothetical protein